eukprot:2929047-Amphidinium_carterae.1
MLTSKQCGLTREAPPQVTSLIRDNLHVQATIKTAPSISKCPRQTIQCNAVQIPSTAIIAGQGSKTV